jgi:hypothetical protein
VSTAKIDHDHDQVDDHELDRLHDDGGPPPCVAAQRRAVAAAAAAETVAQVGELADRITMPPPESSPLRRALIRAYGGLPGRPAEHRRKH